MKVIAVCLSYFNHSLITRFVIIIGLNLIILYRKCSFDFYIYISFNNVMTENGCSLATYQS